jgi:dihydrofolate synthase/folylpolyglutamate synthase
MTYEETLAFLYSYHGSEFHDLRRIRYVLACLKNPQKTFPSVLIAGTNGKGSVAKMLSAILHEAGYRVGCFTSPHLLDFGERITVNHNLISHEKIVALTEEIRTTALGPLARQGEELGITGEVSFFEIVTAMAFLYFARQQVDIAILEVGIGGRLDATNSVEPLVSVITNIGLDHQNFLGDTIEAIAFEKSGVIRQHGEVITGIQSPEALDVISEVCLERQATCYRTGVQGYIPNNGAPEAQALAAQVIPHKVTSTGSFFSYRGLTAEFDDLYVRLSGGHQLTNVATALCAIERLQQKGFACPESAIRSGMGSVRHPGRLEVLCASPLCAVDIAHNAMGAQTIARALPELFEYEHVIVVIGILHDKDVAEILRPFLEVADSMIFTRPHLTDRAESASVIADIAEKLVSSTMTRNTYQHWIVCDSVEQAITRAHQLAGIHDLIVVTGSNYTVSEAEMFYNCARIEDCR